MESQAADTIKMLWVAVGALIASNSGVFIKMFWDYRVKTKEHEDLERKELKTQEAITMKELKLSLEANTKALNQFDMHLQRAFTAVKLLAGDKWAEISKVIQEEIPRS